MALDLQLDGRTIDSQPHCQAATSSKLFIPMCLCHQAVQTGTCVKARKVMAGYGEGMVYHPSCWMQDCEMNKSMSDTVYMHAAMLTEGYFTFMFYRWNEEITKLRVTTQRWQASKLTVVWQAVSITVALGITDISRRAADTGAVTVVFATVSHHAVLQREPRVTHIALKRTFTYRPVTSHQHWHGYRLLAARRRWQRLMLLPSTFLFISHPPKGIAAYVFAQY